MSLSTNPYSASEMSLRKEVASGSDAIGAGYQYFLGCLAVLSPCWLALFRSLGPTKTKSGSIHYPFQFMLIDALVLAFFAALSACVLCLYFKYRLYVDDLIVTQVDVFTTRSINVADIQTIAWQKRLVGGSVIIKNDSQVLIISLGVIDRSKVKGLVDRMRRLVPEHKQVGWDKFKRKLTLDAK